MLKPASDIDNNHAQKLQPEKMVSCAGIILRFLLITLTLTGCLGEANVTQEAPTSAGSAEVSPLSKPTYTVQRGDVVVSISFAGRVMPVNQQPLFFLIAGRVGHVYSQLGNTVQAGQVLADLEAVATLERQKALNELDIQQSQTQAEIARLNLDLYKAQNSPNVSGYSQELAIAEQQLTLAQLAVTRTQLNASALEESINNSKITAPVGGQLRSLDIREGDEVEAYDQVGIVADVSYLGIGCDLDKEILAQLTETMPVSVSPLNNPTQTATGIIRYLPYPYGQGNAAPSQPGDETIAWIDLDAFLADVGLALDDPVTITAVLHYSEKTLWLPPDAIATFDGRTFVIIPEGDLQRRVEVITGLRNKDQVEILNGLTEGQVVKGQ